MQSITVLFVYVRVRSKEMLKMRQGEPVRIILSLKVHLMIINMKTGSTESKQVHSLESLARIIIFTGGRLQVSYIVLVV